MYIASTSIQGRGMMSTSLSWLRVGVLSMAGAGVVGWFRSPWLADSGVA